MKERNMFLDFFRGWAMILVVVGHAIQICSGHTNDPVHVIIQSFQMPLLFIISGFSFGFSEPIKDVKKFFWNKIKRLLVPYVVWSQIHYIINAIVLGDYSLLSQVKNLTESQFWFLRTLFYIFIVYILCYLVYNWLKDKIQTNNIVTACCCIATGALITYVFVYILGVKLVRSYIPFFVLGNLIYKIKDKYTSENLIKAFNVLLGILTVVYIVSITVYFKVDGIVRWLIWMSMAVSGSAAMCVVSKLIYKIKFGSKLKAIVTQIGVNTLPIYAIHWCLLFGIFKVPVYYQMMSNSIGLYLSSFIVSVVWIIICQLMISLLNKHQVTCVALLGGKYKKK